MDNTPGPRRSTEGRIAAVHAQIAIVAFLVVGQLWMLTVAWDELEQGHIAAVSSLAVASAVSFLICLATLLAYRE